MFSALKTIAAELKRANDLKERDIKNKETYNWYNQSAHTVHVQPAPNNNFTGQSYYHR
tara:strand:+ start:303 stop:476 length:174 start_codon:yes stop_codon:yes gene_type:complete